MQFSQEKGTYKIDNENRNCFVNVLSANVETCVSLKFDNLWPKPLTRGFCCCSQQNYTDRRNNVMKSVRPEIGFYPATAVGYSQQWNSPEEK